MCYTQTCFGNFDTCTKSNKCAIYKFVKLLFDLEMLIFKLLLAILNHFCVVFMQPVDSSIPIPWLCTMVVCLSMLKTT